MNADQPQRPRWLPIAAAVCLVVGASVGWMAWTLRPESPALAPQVPPAPAFPGGQATLSNITRESYVGPDACQRCHRKNHTSWLEHPHRRMNQWADDNTVVGDFDDASLRVGSDVAHFKRVAANSYRVVLDRAGVPREYRITRTIGSRFKQYYVGVVERGDAVTGNAPDEEVVLPFGYWIEARRWLPLNYFEDYGADYDAWQPRDIAIKHVCVYCHNTLPYADRFAAFEGGLLGYPRSDLLADHVGLSHVLTPGPGREPLSPGLTRIRSAPFPLKDGLTHIGITCESCHFGARAHAVDDDDYRFGISSPHVAVTPSTKAPALTNESRHASTVRSICRQCHAASGSGYPDGSSHESSSEAMELDRGECVSQITCTDCHNPHVAGPRHEGGPDNPKHLAACTGCHAQYNDAAAEAAHSHHSEDSVTCLDCHMPRITEGIVRAVRSHRISVPGDPKMLREDAPNACNFCHLDQSTRWTAETIARLWGTSAADAAPQTGDPTSATSAENAIDAWTRSDNPSIRSVALDALERSGDPRSWPRLAAFLNDPSPSLRSKALLAAERVLGRRLSTTEIDITAPATTRQQQITTLPRP